MTLLYQCFNERHLTLERVYSDTQLGGLLTEIKKKDLPPCQTIHRIPKIALQQTFLWKVKSQRN